MVTYIDPVTGDEVIDITPEEMAASQAQPLEAAPAARNPPCPVVPPGMLHMRSAAIGGVAVLGGIVAWKAFKFFF